MNISNKDQLYLLVDQLVASDDQQARDILTELRDRVSRGTLSRTRGYNRSLLRDALDGSNAGREEFNEECIATLSASYNHPPLGGAGCFAYEAPYYFLDVPNAPTLTAAAPEATRRVEFGQAGAGGVRIVGLMGTLRRADTGTTIPNEGVEVRLTVNGNRTLTTNGQRDSFINFGTLFNSAGAYFPFSRLVSSRDFIDVTFRSRNAAPIVDVIPNFTFVTGVLPFLSNVVRNARQFLQRALELNGSHVAEEFDRECVDQLWDMYRERAPAQGCMLTYESPTRLLEANLDESTGLPLTVAQGTELTRRIVFNQGGGIIVGMMGAVEDPTNGFSEDMSAIHVRLTINGTENLNITGRTESFTPYNELFSQPALVVPTTQRQPFVPLRRLVTSRDFLDVRWRNVLPVGGATVIPYLTLAFGRLTNIASKLC